MIFRSKAPLRLGLAGGGTDVSPYCDDYGGYVLNATINMYAHCTLTLTDNDSIIFNALDREEIFESRKVPQLDLDGHMNLHKAIYNKIINGFNNGIPIGVTVSTYSDAPAGSGLGSSSTVVVAILKAFVEALSLPLGEYDIAQLAYEIERIDVKLNGGKQDQYAATFGGFNFMEFYSDNRVIVNPLRIKNWIVNELESSLVLYFTGISRESAKIIDEQSQNAIKRKQVTIEAMHQMKNDALGMKEAILKGDILKLAERLGASWEAKKKSASSVSNEYLDKVYETAIRAGAYSGKISGAGGGGFMMFIVDPVKKLDVIKGLNKLGGEVKEVQFTKYGTQGWRYR